MNQMQHLGATRFCLIIMNCKWRYVFESINGLFWQLDQFTQIWMLQECRNETPYELQYLQCKEKYQF